MGESCPAIQDWWDKAVFRPFYLVGNSHEAQQIITPAGPLESRHIIDRDEYVTFEGRTWRAAGMQVVWSPGTIQHPWSSGPHTFDHWHTDFSVQDHAVHIDFVSFFRMGPQTSYREYRVFCDGQEIKRGGGFMGFLMFVFTRQRNWPLAVEIGDHLIYIGGFLQYWTGASKGKIDEEELCSVWVLAD
jgi:hypothetical protein